jgi:biotin operon repressor
VTKTEFVAAWGSSTSRAEVAEKTGMTLAEVRVYAQTLRKSKVFLPRINSANLKQMASTETETRPPKKEVVKGQKVSKVEFVAAWELSTSAREVAEKTGMTLAEVRVYAQNLRKSGFFLPRINSANRKQVPHTETETRPPKKEKGRGKVSEAEFVAAWTSSSNTAEVAEKLGYTVHGVRSRATLLRKQGVELPKMVKFAGDSSTLTVEEFLAVSARCHDYTEMSELLNLATYTLRRKAKALGVEPVFKQGNPKKPAKSVLNQLAATHGFASWREMQAALKTGQYTITVTKKEAIT